MNNMKKLFTIIGGLVAATAVVTTAIVILKKIKLSFSIECADDNFVLEDEDDDIAVSIEPTDEADDEEREADDGIGFAEDLADLEKLDGASDEEGQE